MKGTSDNSSFRSPSFTYTIPGKPTPLARPRFTKHKVYDSQTEIKEEAIWHLYMQRNKTIHKYPLDGPLQLDVTFHMPIPKSASKKLKKNLPGTPHHKKPDIDNLIKFILDVAQGIIIADDKHVTIINAQKIYSSTPKTTFTLRQLHANTDKKA
jgi:Holliday junction resolvase RusA-like endonuclease